jgi:hypothetical protein
MPMTIWEHPLRGHIRVYQRDALLSVFIKHAPGTDRQNALSHPSQTPDPRCSRFKDEIMIGLVY